MQQRTHTLRTLTSLALGIVLAGALLAGLLLPWIGGPAVAAQQSTSFLGEPPLELTDAPPPGNTVMLAANGEVITHFYQENRDPVPSGRIAEVMKHAMVAIEDARFYDHGGLDAQGTVRAVVTNVASGQVMEGGSTLTQQLVKQTLLQSAADQKQRDAATAQTLARKIREARLALALEDTYSKDELLTRYLNIVYFGRNAYGIEPAARAFFGVEAAALTLPQAATLAGLVQSPTDDDPFVNPEGATIRRNQVLTRMAAQGYITPAQKDEAVATPLVLAPAPAPARGCAEASVGAYVCDRVRQYLIDRGMTQDQLDRGGYVITTTLDPELQRSGDAAVLATLPLEDERAATFSAVEPGTGHLLALSVNRIFGYDLADRRQESYPLNVAPSRGSGSTYKVFVAAAALARGYSSSYTLTAPSPYASRVYREGGGPYTVSNAGSYRATLDLTTALYQSSNTYFVALEDELGSVEEPVAMARKMGLYQFGPEGVDDDVIEQNRGSFTLGPDATSPLGLASAYSTLAASGTQCDVVPVTEVTDPFGKPAADAHGKPLDLGDRCTVEAIPPGVADTLTQMLRKDVEPGSPGQTAPAAYVPGHQIAGKTGTAQGNVSVTFVGYTPEIAASAMVFNPKRNQDVGGFGGGKGAAIWHDAMAPILQARGSGEFPPSDPVIVRGKTLPVPACVDVSDCESRLRAAGLLHRVASVASELKAGDLVGTRPARGASVLPGQLVEIRESDGSGYVEPRAEPTPRPAPVPEPVLDLPPDGQLPGGPSLLDPAPLPR